MRKLFTILFAAGMLMVATAGDASATWRRGAAVYSNSYGTAGYSNYRGMGYANSTYSGLYSPVYGNAYNSGFNSLGYGGGNYGFQYMTPYSTNYGNSYGYVPYYSGINNGYNRGYYPRRR